MRCHLLQFHVASPVEKDNLCNWEPLLLNLRLWKVSVYNLVSLSVDFSHNLLISRHCFKLAEIHGMLAFWRHLCIHSTWSGMVASVFPIFIGWNSVYFYISIFTFEMSVFLIRIYPKPVHNHANVPVAQTGLGGRVNGTVPDSGKSTVQQTGNWINLNMFHDFSLGMKMN